jgi:hypothetical protein
MTVLSLGSLPNELVEAILVFSAQGDSHSSIAALSETCHDYFNLIYAGADSHLWREVFLVTFDEPRTVQGIIQSVSQPDSSPAPFDWHGEFVSRMLARKMFTKAAGPSSPPGEVSRHVQRVNML